MSQATVTLPIDSYNRLVEQAQDMQSHTQSLAKRLEELRAKPVEMTRQGLDNFLGAAISILQSPIVEPKAAIPAEPPAISGAGKSQISPKSRN